VKTDDISELRAALIDPIFFLAREIVSGRVSGMGSYAGISRLASADLPSNEALKNAFLTFAKKQGAWKFTDKQLTSETAFITLRLRYYIAMASFGVNAAQQVLTENDPQVAKAIEILPRAGQLAQMAAKQRLNK
ncbi:MAG: hypothetical protein ABL952_06875, partial [Pyrinomonadaceae bacterium]